MAVAWMGTYTGSGYKLVHPFSINYITDYRLKYK